MDVGLLMAVDNRLTFLVGHSRPWQHMFAVDKISVRVIGSRRRRRIAGVDAFDHVAAIPSLVALDFGKHNTTGSCVAIRIATQVRLGSNRIIIPV